MAMTAGVLALVLCVLCFAGFWLGRQEAVRIRSGGVQPHSLPSYYGSYVALVCGIPASLALLIWISAADSLVRQFVIAGLPDHLSALPEGDLALLLTDVRNMAYGRVPLNTARPEIVGAVEHYLRLGEISRWLMWLVVLALAIGGLLLGRRMVSAEFRARNAVEQILNILLIASSTVAVLTTIAIVLSLIFEALRFFAKVPVTEFLFGLTWSPQTALRAEQVGASGAFGAVPLITGTMLISVIAMLVAVPTGLMAAVYMSEFMPGRLRAVVKPVLEILAGIPTVVYGFFAALTVAPLVRDAGMAIGLNVASQSALAAGVVMGIMIIPFVSSLSDDVLNAVPNSLREGSYGLGATQAETIKLVLLPAALPGIVASVILAFSRALGETMIVVMAAGLAANITINPLDAVTTVTVHIAALLVGDQEFDSAKTLSAFALGLLLFVVTLTLNVIAQRVVKKYREQYE
ncbi:phosphate ABC transporter permease subunit PstC [Elioraea tepidiphila]|jgi:phosphate transport system permease protein|uniref:phosphate ABC transporter permease subunit PstC n=1 Tax=Elioraea tepidiphila TaxID=457934 RepID=UPI0003613E73